MITIRSVLCFYCWLDKIKHLKHCSCCPGQQSSIKTFLSVSWHSVQEMHSLVYEENNLQIARLLHFTLCFWFSVFFASFRTACGRGFYKSSSQDLQCSRCPVHSFNDREGSWRCDCEDGYYRALSDPPSVACTSKSAMLLYKRSADHMHLNSY